MSFNPTNTLKNSFIDFVRYFYDPNIQYVSHLRTKWIKELVPFVLDIILSGFVFYLVLFGIVFVFPKISAFIFLGTTYWHIPMIIFFLGIILWFFENRYQYIRGGYKK